MVLSMATHVQFCIYLKCHNNNTAETALFEFTQAVNGYGIPSRVRTDKGGENRGIAWFILNHPERGPERGSVIAGRSVHNQRQERLWGDVNYGVHMFSIHSFITWKNRVFLIQQINYTFAFIMSLSPE